MNGKIIQNVFNFQIDISYNQNHQIYKYISNLAYNNNCYFNNNFAIPTNMFNRIDYTNYLINCDISVFNNISKHIKKYKSNVIINNNIRNCEITLDNKNTTQLQSLIHKLSCSQNKYEFIIDLLITIRNKIIDTKTLALTYYFLGLQEWFSITVLGILHKLYYTDLSCTFILGEYIKIIPNELIKMNNNELHNYLRKEYSSHSILYIINNDTLYLYDPDNYEDYTLLLPKITNVLNINKYTTINTSSIQEKYDDSYCIFYCIKFMLDIIEEFANSMILDDVLNKLIYKHEIMKKNDIIIFANKLI